MQQSIMGQVALVTGAAHRVGKAIAFELARRGAHQVVHYHASKPETVEQTLSELRALGVQASAIQADISQLSGVEAVFNHVVERFGKLNILVNSASIFQKRTLDEVTPEEWDETMRVNLKAPFMCTQAAAKLMRHNDPIGGVIVNILDRGSVSPWPDFAHHGISKAGLFMLTKTAAVSYAPHIRVNGVIPGPVMKPDYLSDQDWVAAGNRTLLKRVGFAEDVARAVAYLVEEDYLTGVTIPVNGGRNLT